MQSNKETHLKYRIAEILAAFPPKVRTAKRVELLDKLGFTTEMFSKYIYTTTEKTLDFKGTQLPTIATVLNCQIEELFQVVGLKKV
jgi:hypothetical protein